MDRVRIVFKSTLLALAISASMVQGQGPSATIGVLSNGLSRVDGTTDAAMAYAAGRQQMMDYPVLTLFNLRWGRGRLSESLGLGAVDNVYATPHVFAGMGVIERGDVEALLWRIEEAANRHLLRMQASSDPEVVYALDLLCHFAKGIDDGRVASASINPTGRWPIFVSASEWARMSASPVEPIDVLCFAQRWLSQIPLSPINCLSRTLSLASCTGFGFSNAWGITAGSTASNSGALLGSDPHQPFDTPYLFPVWSVLVGADYAAAGWGYAGLLGPVVGSAWNPASGDSVAWTASTNSPYIYDLWQLSLDGPGFPDYNVGTRTATISTTMHTLSYFDPMTMATQTKTVSLSFAEDGKWPIVRYDSSNYTIVYAAAAFVDNDRSFFEFLIGLARSTRASENPTSATPVSIEDAALLNILPNQNLIAVDSGGRSAWWSLGQVPDMSQVSTTWCPDMNTPIKDGHDASKVWQLDITGRLLVQPVNRLPSIKHDDLIQTTQQVLMNNNVSPEFTGLITQAANTCSSPSTALNSYGNTVPPYAASAATIQCSGWRQDRGRVLLDPVVSGGITLNIHQATLTDVRDNWAVALIPYFRKAITEATPYLSSAQLAAANGILSPLESWLVATGGGDAERASTVATSAAVLRAYYFYKWKTGASTVPSGKSRVGIDDLCASSLPSLNSFSLASVHDYSIFFMVVGLVELGSVIPDINRNVFFFQNWISANLDANNSALLCSTLVPSQCLPNLIAPFLPPSIGDPVPLGLISQVQRGLMLVPRSGVSDSLFQVDGGMYQDLVDPSVNTTNPFGLQVVPGSQASSQWWANHWSRGGSRTVLSAELFPSTLPSVAFICATGFCEDETDFRHYQGLVEFGSRTWTQLPLNVIPTAIATYSGITCVGP